MQPDRVASGQGFDLLDAGIEGDDSWPLQTRRADPLRPNPDERAADGHCQSEPADRPFETPAAKGEAIKIITEGADADAAMTALGQLVQSGFGDVE